MSNSSGSGKAAGLVRASGIDPRMLAMIGALVAIWLVLNVLTGGIFLSPRNLYNLAVQSSVVGIMATGMVFIIVARHIDLSVGSVVGATGMLIAWLQVQIFPIDAAWGWQLSIVIGLLAGAAIGVWQGYWVAYQGIPAFIVTLGGLLLFRGVAFMITDGRTVAPMNESYQLLGGGIHGSLGETWSWIVGLIAVAAVTLMTVRSRRRKLAHKFPVKPLWMEFLLFALWVALIVSFVLVMNSYYKPRTEIPRGIPVPVLLLILVVIVMTGIARFTKFGRYVFAIGGNLEAAKLSGIDVARVTQGIFVVMGVLAALAAMITTARLNAGTNSMGTLAELNVIAAAVIGGTSLAGGVGSVPGAILGAVIMQSLDNGMVLLGVDSAMRQVIMGLVLIAAVWLDVLYNRSRSA